MIKKCTKILVMAYLVIMFLFFPFYLQNGYQEIGDVKYHFFLYVSLGMLILFIPAIIYGIIQRIFALQRKERTSLIAWDQISGMDLWVLLFGSVGFVSFSFSKYREQAFYGAEGWNIGFLFYLTLCLLYFVISRAGEISESDRSMLQVALMLSSGLVCLLGIFNRFSWYPSIFPYTDPVFLSTIGNINWYCGFLSVTLPVGVCLLVVEDKGFWYKACYALIAFMASLCQGADSVFIILFVLFSYLLWISFTKRVWMLRFSVLLILFGCAETVLLFIRRIFPDKYNYDTENLCGYLTEYPIGLLVISIGLALYILTKKGTPLGEEIFRKRMQRLRIAFTICLILGTICLIGFTYSHFDPSFGNGRGAAFLTGWTIFRGQDLFHKVFGVGPDCFSIYAYQSSELQELLHQSFGSAVLTNAHNEMLTLLVNLGFVGVCSFIGIWMSAFLKALKAGREQPKRLCFACVILCYLAHNMVSFQQVLNLPYLFLFLAVEKACILHGQKGVET